MRLCSFLLLACLSICACSARNTLVNKDFGYSLPAPHGWVIHRKPFFPDWEKDNPGYQHASFMKNADALGVIVIAGQIDNFRFNSRTLNLEKFQENMLGNLNALSQKGNPPMHALKWSLQDSGYFQARTTIDEQTSSFKGSLHFTMRMIPYKCPDGRLCHVLLTSVSDDETARETNDVLSVFTDVFVKEHGLLK